VSIDKLGMKGFHVQRLKTEDACITELESKLYQVTRVISHMHVEKPRIIFALPAFHSSGSVLFHFANNTLHQSCVKLPPGKFGIVLEGIIR
jgi:hypothetical protein